MEDTRETLYKLSDTVTDKDTKCRFNVNDVVLIPHDGKPVKNVIRDIFWDKEFGGWMVVCHLIGVHESNYIKESEKDKWIPHEDGLWSWWTRKAFISERSE